MRISILEDTYPEIQLGLVMWICEQRVLESPVPPISATETQRFLTPQGTMLCSLDLNSNFSEVHTDTPPLPTPPPPKPNHLDVSVGYTTHYGFLLKYDPSIPLHINMQEVGWTLLPLPQPPKKATTILQKTQLLKFWNENCLVCLVPVFSLIKFSFSAVRL